MKTAKLLFLFILAGLFLHLTPSPALAVDPLQTPNNKFGIHIISSSTEELNEARDLVNSEGGKWGYVTFLIESNQRDTSRWQAFFNELRRRHLIPIVRIATKPEGGNWARPYEGEETAWADFLDNLVWPGKNRYVIIYNEPNHANEWAGTVDPKSYAEVLSKTVDALKKKNPDFFVINAGLDGSAPNKMPAYMDSKAFMEEMQKAVPGIFDKLDGWSSHSYPNPAFQGSPDGTGKISVRGFEWELEQLKRMGVTKKLPVFITETGWKHSEGKSSDRSLMSPDKAAENYKRAFEGAWKSDQVVAVTPFLLNYQDPPFDHFSFKKITKNSSAAEFYPMYDALKSLPKVRGVPVQDFKARLQKGGISIENFTNSLNATDEAHLDTTLVSGQVYEMFLTVKNTGHSIWNDEYPVSLVPQQGAADLGVETVYLPAENKVEPGQSYTFKFKVNAPKGGNYNIRMNMYADEKSFTSSPFEFSLTIKSPVVLKITSSLKWKNNFNGEYILTVFGDVKNAINRSVMLVVLGNEGISDRIENKYLLPDRDYEFTLERPFYKSKTIRQTVNEGENLLDFGELQPDIPSAILHPQELWNLLPWSD